MGPLRTYGVLNAKVRAMRSVLLSTEQYLSLIRAEDLRETIRLLGEYGYAALAEEAGHADTERLELALKAEELHRIRRIAGKAGRPVSAVLHEILQEFEAERLKWILRLWFQKRGEPKTFLRDPALSPLPVHEIFDAPALDDVLHLLRGHPFHRVLTDARVEFEAKQTLFPFELAIDREQIRRFFESIEKLNRRDRRICRELAGIEIDLKNLNWIERFRRYYKMGSAEILSRLLPGGQRLGPDRLRRIVSEGRVGPILSEWEQDIPIPPEKEGEAKLMLQNLELFLNHVMLRRARRAFAGFPFSIGAVLGYRLLLGIQTMNLRTVIQGKAYELAADELQSRLVI